MILRKSRERRRAGVAAVEMAVLMPLLATLAVGTIELSRLMQVKNTLADCARHGCRKAALPRTSTAQVKQQVNQVLAAAGISTAAATVTVKLNGTPADVSDAKAGDTVEVEVSVPAAAVNWAAVMLFSESTVTSDALTMMRQN
jgi:Flp pilus assembly protein TadG